MERSINLKTEALLDNMNENQFNLLVNSVTTEKVELKRID